MPLIELYENRIPLDEELPIQISLDEKSKPGPIFLSHWHEDVEIHYIAKQISRISDSIYRRVYSFMVSERKEQ